MKWFDPPWEAKWWHVAPGALLFLTAAVILTPQGLREVREGRQLAHHGVHMKGVVAQHRPAFKECESRALIAFAVDGIVYQVPVRGCDAHPDRTPIGAPADVVYLPENPRIADASLPQASTQRFNPLVLLGLWVTGPAATLFALYLWRKERASRREREKESG